MAVAPAACMPLGLYMETYCIYSDKMTSDPTWEHIIPLSLGGHDDFVITVDRKINCDIGSKIDGRLSNDFLILFDRDRAAAKGYSRKHPRPVVKSASLKDGTPVHAIFGKDGLELFDLKRMTSLERRDCRGQTIQLRNDSISTDIYMMFVAKVALAAGYFVYGENFRKYVDHSEFRLIMNMDKNNLPTNSKALAYHRFYEPSNDDINYHIKSLATELGDCSSVVILPSQDRFGVAVGVLGMFLGFISVPAESKHLPNEKAYRYGHCIYLQDGQLYRYSFDHVREKMIEMIEQ